MTFEEMLPHLKKGIKFFRSNWNGKHQFIFFLDPHTLSYESLQLPKHEIYFGPFIAIKTERNEYIPWLASQTDILADDWIEWKD